MQSADELNQSGPILRVLLVEDHKETAETQRWLIDALGFEAKACYDGDEALRTYREFCPDVVLLDLGLPGMDGFAVANRILEESDCPRPLLIALTGHDTEADRQRSRDAGIDHYFVKPAVPSDLIGLLSAEAARRGKGKKQAVKPSSSEVS